MRPPATAVLALLAAAGCQPAPGEASPGRARFAVEESPAPRAASSTPPSAAYSAADEPALDLVILVSVDGLRSDALLAEPGALAAFDRLRQGAHTLNARTDPDATITLPNHTGMLTGRLQQGPEGHLWPHNDDVEDAVTLHALRGAYTASVFDVVHDRGGYTAIVAGKTKFRVYDASFDAERGAADAVPPDHGSDKVDRYDYAPQPEQEAELVLAELAEERAGAKRFLFVHFAATDYAGHKHGWDLTAGSKYLLALRAVDAQLGRILDALQSAPHLAGRSAVILTADHGGGAPLRSHERTGMWVNYVIPFLVWSGAGASAELYALNATTRADPSLTQPPRDAERAPVRNSDAANLALDLLGLPAVPGSTVNAKQDLRALLRPVADGHANAR